MINLLSVKEWLAWAPRTSHMYIYILYIYICIYASPWPLPPSHLLGPGRRPVAPRSSPATTGRSRRRDPTSRCRGTPSPLSSAPRASRRVGSLADRGCSDVWSKWLLRACERAMAAFSFTSSWDDEAPTDGCQANRLVIFLVGTNLTC